MKLDPLMADMMKVLELPILSDRRAANRVADRIAACATDLAVLAEREGDPLAVGQLDNAARALMACMFSVAAYARGKTPQVASKAPDATIITQ